MLRTLDEIKGVGKKTVSMLNRLGIETPEDLLNHYPRRYEQYVAPTPCAQVTEGRFAVSGIVNGRFRSGSSGSVSLTLNDGTGEVVLRWFRTPYVARMLTYGKRYVFCGNVSFFAGRPCMSQPTFYAYEDYLALQGTISPVYGLTKGLSNQTMFRLVLSVISEMDEPEDRLPESVRIEYGLISKGDALRCVHYPADWESLEMARRRLIFEEFYSLIYKVRYRAFARGENLFRFPKSEAFEKAKASLPYELTGAQERVLGDVVSDMKGFLVCNRLIQGDVGCGKTAVALLAMIFATENGYQAALMAPTEVLAAQHYAEAESLLERAGLREELRPVLLTGSMKEKEKKEVRETIRTGESRLVIGTHALIQDKTEYRNLALAIVDEQHRFGVEQREAFASKSRIPLHEAIMTATPIPRTTGNILFGGMDFSSIDEKPAKRIPIKSLAAFPSMTERAYALIRREISAGRQAYVICPMVEENHDGGRKSVEGYHKILSEAFPGVGIGKLHGKMDPKEKLRQMEAFSNGTNPILAATTVVEVGVNVPNATVILIEDADSFGMLQLHQLRGRVGRGSAQSYCIFMNSKEERSEKLEILSRTENGFEIAEADYRMRKAGNLLGTRQSGSMGFRIADPVRDEAIMKEAEEAARKAIPEISVH